jgi:hypothetical protein
MAYLALMMVEPRQNERSRRFSLLHAKPGVSVQSAWETLPMDIRRDLTVVWFDDSILLWIIKDRPYFLFLMNSHNHPVQSANQAAQPGCILWRINHAVRIALALPHM